MGMALLHGPAREEALCHQGLVHAAQQGRARGQTAGRAVATARCPALVAHETEENPLKLLVSFSESNHGEVIKLLS